MQVLVWKAHGTQNKQEPRLRRENGSPGVPNKETSSHSALDAICKDDRPLLSVANDTNAMNMILIESDSSHTHKYRA